MRLPSREELRRIFDYDAERGVLVWKYRPDLDARRNNRFAGRDAGHVSRAGYVQVHVVSRLELAHRVIWKWLHDDEPEEIDHKDVNPSNNREENLRPATRSQNMANRRARIGKTLPKGVVLTKHGRYRAEITVGGVNVHLGNFITSEDASCAFAEAAQFRYGEFARS